MVLQNQQKSMKNRRSSTRSSMRPGLAWLVATAAGVSTMASTTTVVASFVPQPTTTSTTTSAGWVTRKASLPGWKLSSFTASNSNSKTFFKPAPHFMHPDEEGMEHANVLVESSLSSAQDTTTAKEMRLSTDPTPVLVSFLSKLLNGGNNHGNAETDFARSNNSNNSNMLQAGMAAMALAVLLTISSPDMANAAMSGGRMGGSFSSGRSSSSYGSPGRVYSAPRGGGYYPRTSGGITIAPIMPITPFAPVVPYFGPPITPYYGGGGAGIITYSRGPSFFDLLFFGGIGFVIWNTIRGFGRDSSTMLSSSTTTEAPWGGLLGSTGETSALGAGTSVVQLSVAMQVPNRDDPNSSILSVLHRLSQTAKTDSRVGIQNLLNQVAVELLRRKSYIVSAAGKYNHYKDRNQAQRAYNSAAVRERSKFESETVSKYGGVDYSRGSGSSSSSLDSSSSSSSKATMAVITLLLAIDGDSTKISNTMSSMSDVETALRTIAADARVDDCLQSLDILWTPESRFETLTEKDVAADYPELRRI